MVWWTVAKIRQLSTARVTAWAGAKFLIWDRIGFAIRNLFTGIRVFLASLWLGANYCFNGNGFSDNTPDIQRIEVKKLSDQI